MQETQRLACKGSLVGTILVGCRVWGRPPAVPVRAPGCWGRHYMLLNLAAGGPGGACARPQNTAGNALVCDPSMFRSTITNSFSDVHRPTLGVDFHFRRFEEGGTGVALQLWDIAGGWLPCSSHSCPPLLCACCFYFSVWWWFSLQAKIASAPFTGCVSSYARRESCVLCSWFLCDVCVSSALVSPECARGVICFSVTPVQVYYKDAFGAILVFDLSRPETFTNVIKVCLSLR